MLKDFRHLTGGDDVAVFISSKTVSNVPAFNWYKEVIIAGATRAGFPSNYIHEIAGLKSIEDIPPVNTHSKLNAVKAMNKAGWLPRNGVK